MREHKPAQFFAHHESQRALTGSSNNRRIDKGFAETQGNDYAAFSSRSLIVHTCPVSLAAIASVHFLPAPIFFRQKLYHATNSEVMAA